MCRQYIHSILIFLFGLLLSAPVTLSAQVKVDTWIKDRPYMIGEVMDLQIKVERPQNIDVRWPFLIDTVGYFEIHSFTNIDSSLEGTLAKESQRVSLQVFDSGDYVFPPLAFEVSGPGGSGSDMIYTDSLYVRVETVPIDTLGEIMAIKPPVDLPRTFWEKARFLVIPVAALLLLGLLLWIFIKRRKPVEEKVVKPIDKRSLQQIYVSRLAELRKKGYLEENRIKEHYIELTDIIREYIQHRYDVPAMEMTSSEVGAAIKGEKSVNKGRFRSILNMLTTADLVKFAKGRPPSSYHEESYKAAKDFIEQTAINHSEITENNKTE